MCIKEIISYLVNEKLQLKAVIITHGHWDHIIGLNTLISQYPQLTVYINQWDENFIYHHPYYKMLVDHEQISEATKTNINLIPIIGSTALKLIGYDFLCQHIPGHTPGSQYILIKELNAVFIGYTILKIKLVIMAFLIVIMSILKSHYLNWLNLIKNIKFIQAIEIHIF
ncbi:MBL fold metallo-hydrolase [Spiroplasma endosymbiont of Virgichneumon dumeticola]|uniref:MBL fold metallo-hydrolase n=1 Tax=Spiroplasma endosymbiont of Virgichneumon dumeticola TaxID=3139323 RepID=UPI0035C90BA6